jgi:hypothetical protein
MKKYIGRLIKIKFKDMEPIVGIVLDFNDEWMLMKNSPVDYVVDGYFIVRNKNIKEAIRGDAEKWREKVINLKTTGSTRKVKLPLDNLEKIIKAVNKKYGVFAVHTKEDDVCWLGRLNTIDDKSLVIDDLTPKAKWDGQFKFKVNDIRVIEFDTDYVNSLKLVLNKSRAKTGSR